MELDELLQRLEARLEEVEQLDPEARDAVFELLDGLDALHRMALNRLAESVDPGLLERMRKDPAVAWLLDAYSIGVDEKAAADQALESIKPYIHSHGGRVEVVDARDGVVRVRMSGSCAGCTASAITLKQGIEEALRDNFPGFVTIEAEEEEAEAHPPPGATLLQIEPGLGA